MRATLVQHSAGVLRPPRIMLRIPISWYSGSRQLHHMHAAAQMEDISLMTCAEQVLMRPSGIMLRGLVNLDMGEADGCGPLHRVPTAALMNRRVMSSS